MPGPTMLPFTGVSEFRAGVGLPEESLATDGLGGSWKLASDCWQIDISQW